MPQKKGFCNDYSVIISICRFFQARKKKLKWTPVEKISTGYSTSKRKISLCICDFPGSFDPVLLNLFSSNNQIYYFFVLIFINACPFFWNLLLLLFLYHKLAYLPQKSRRLDYQAFLSKHLHTPQPSWLQENFAPPVVWTQFDGNL